MQRLLAAIALLSLSAVWPAERTAAQDADALFLAGSTAFEEGDYLRALAFFQDARDAGIEGPAIHYNIGVCEYRLGDYAGAETAFRTVADEYPAMRALALYNLGLVRVRQDRDADARELFEQARRESNDPKIAQLAEAMLRRTAPAGETVRSSRWRSVADLGIGYDDNVALLDEASLPAAQSVDSVFTEIFAALSGPMSADAGFRFDASAYAVHYPDASVYDQTALRVGGVYHWTGAGWYLEAGPSLNRSTLDGDGFEQRIGVDLWAWRALSAATSVQIRVSHEDIDSIESQFAYIEGSREQLGVAWERRDGAGGLSLGYDLELNDRADPRVSPTRHRLWTRYRYSPSPEWTADVQLALRVGRYGDLPVAREEDLTDLSLGFVRRFPRGWQLSGRYRWSDNDADVERLTYSRNRLTVGLRKNF